MLYSHDGSLTEGPLVMGSPRSGQLENLLDSSHQNAAPSKQSFVGGIEISTLAGTGTTH